MTARQDRNRVHRLRFRGHCSPQELLDLHYELWVNDYQCTYGGFARLFEEIGGSPQRILETGTSAWGIDSTRLWDEYVRRFGGVLWSVDLREEPRSRLIDDMGPATTLVVDDSVAFMKRLAERDGQPPIDLFYLDSYDLDWSDPAPAEEHCLNEWEMVRRLSHSGSLVLIDDTPMDPWRIPRNRPEAREAARRIQVERGFPPGKGAQVLNHVKDDPSVEILWQHYNVLLRILS